MFTNNDILNIMLNNGMEYIMDNVPMKKIEDEKFRTLIAEYLDLRKKMVQYIIEGAMPKKDDGQIELDLK